MKLLKEFFTAHYDPSTGKIGGCRKNGFAYFHELRHQEQFDDRWTFWLNTYSAWFGQLFGTFLFILLTTAGQMWNGLAMLGVMFLPHLTIVFILEIDAWIQGVIYYRRFKKDYKRS